MCKIKTKKISGVYCIKDSKGVVVYVGSANDMHKRISVHKSNLRNNKHRNKKLQELYNNKVEFTYEVLEECLKRDLFIKEKHYMEVYADTIVNENKIKNTTKKVRRGKEAKNYKAKMSVKNSGENNPSCKINREIAANIKWLYANGYVTIKELAECLDVSISTVNHVIYNRWKDVEPTKPEEINDILCDNKKVLNRLAYLLNASEDEEDYDKIHIEYINDYTSEMTVIKDGEVVEEYSFLDVDRKRDSKLSLEEMQSMLLKFNLYTQYGITVK